MSINLSGNLNGRTISVGEPAVDVIKGNRRGCEARTMQKESARHGYR